MAYWRHITGHGSMKSLSKQFQIDLAAPRTALALGDSFA